ncbi:hypothetical protein T09_13355 [Trichinella sp. T9]|nr:hypothetical protein T09_13355 [Trichinella sp. T9]
MVVEVEKLAFQIQFQGSLCKCQKVKLKKQNIHHQHNSIMKNKVIIQGDRFDNAIWLIKVA